MKLALFIAVCAAFGLSAPSNAQELVTNGGFETGDFSGWTQSGNTFATIVCGPSCANSGNVGARLGTAPGSSTFTGTLSQVITTVPGQSYNVSFWLANYSLDPSISFDFFWDGTNRLSFFTSPGTFFYSLESFNLIAFDTQTQILFDYRNANGYWLLDDVSVQAANTTSVPEPATWTMMLLGFGVAGFAMRKRGRRTLMQLA